MELLNNLNRIHTTPLGLERIKKNLDLDEEDIISWCINKIKDSDSKIIRRGKNWYIEIEDIILTINAYSYTIITAHRKNKIK